MTMLPDNSERDRALSKAWREHSAEMPPGHLDAAIRAAARRAVGSVPRDAATPEATSPQRWWMPLAAAATIGAVALGVLQTLPPDQPVTSPSVSDMPAAPPVSPPASSAAQSARDKLAPIERKDKTQANADSLTAPAGAVREQGESVAPPSAAPVARREQAESAAPPSAVTVAPRTFKEVPTQEAPNANVPMKQASKIEAQRAAGNAGAPAPAMDAAPQPFPAEGKREAADTATKERGGAAPGAAIVPNAAPGLAAVPTPPASEFQGRSDAAAASRSQAAPSARPPSAPPAFAAPPQEPAGPAQPTDEMRQRNEMPQSPPVAAGAVTLAKKSAGAEKDNEMRGAAARDAAVKDSGKAVDVDARIARIRKLHDDGKLADAAKELNALRAAVPDADNRLPPELRAWAATVKR